MIYGVKFFKKFFFVLLLAFIICFVASCTFSSSPSTPRGNIPKFPVQYELGKDSTSFTLEVDGATDVFMARMNVGTVEIAADKTRNISSFQFTPAEDESDDFLPVKISTARNALVEVDSLKDVSGITPSGIIRRDFIPARDFVPPSLEGLTLSYDDYSPSSRNAVGQNNNQSSLSTQKLSVGTEKDIWTNVPSSVAGDEKETYESYTKRPATLQAVGRYCYVWVLNTYFSESSSGNKINSTKAQSLANKFDDLYPLVRGVFGNESDRMIAIKNGKTVITNISNVSNTGNMVNIVVCDIEGDYSPEQNSGIVGYFNPIDYYSRDVVEVFGTPVYTVSNSGKYFYVDSGFFNISEETVYSTLAHEFQHMINFGVKTISSMTTGKTVQSNTWFNEMMSMVCEDMIQEFLGIPDEDSPLSRFSTFCSSYYDSGVIDWLSSDELKSYASAYAFGAYLARNYGGVNLFKKIANSPYVDQEAITEALVGSGENFDTVFIKYPQALLLDNPPKEAYAPSFNKSVPGINGTMKAINIFKQKGINQESGPILLDYTQPTSLRPYGFTLHRLGETPSAGRIQINFTPSQAENEKVYIFVQPKKP